MRRTLLAADRNLSPDRPTIQIAAGAHGDEPAAPWALLSLVRDGLLDDAFGYRLWPCMNPSGYELGTRESAEGHDLNRTFGRGGTSPEARAIITANRDRRFALALDLHEDFEASGFYCFEPPVDGVAPLGEAVLRALDDEGLPIQDLHEDFELGDPRPEPGSRVLERGRVLTETRVALAHFGSALPQSLYLLRSGTRRTLTFESPRCRPWTERIAIHRVAVVAAIARLRTLLAAEGAGVALKG
ncbi:MAG: hypothetical protein ACREM2_01420 [Vulcanimicrobiaceae bacterium]